MATEDIACGEYFDESRLREKGQNRPSGNAGRTSTNSGARSSSKETPGSKEQQKEDKFLQKLQLIEQEVGTSDAICHMTTQQQAGFCRYSLQRLTLQELRRIPAVVLMNSGRFEELTLRAILDLFHELDEDANGFLDYRETKLLLTEVLDPPCTETEMKMLYQLTDQESDERITPEEFHAAFTSNGHLKDHMRQLQNQAEIKKLFAHSLGENAVIDRPLLVERLGWRVSRDDSFRTLPFSLFYISLFIALVILHLRVYERQRVETGMRSWLHNYGGNYWGPYFQDDIISIDSMWIWLADSGLPAVLGDCELNSKGEHFCYLANGGVVVGDVILEQSRVDGTTESVWLLHSDQAIAYLSQQPDDFKGAALAVLENLRSTGWTDRQTIQIKLSFISYYSRSETYLDTKVQFSIDEFGYPVEVISNAAVGVNPYPTWYYVIPDVAYLLCILFPLYSEATELVGKVVHTGLHDGFVSYWGIWNLVDWIGIIMGGCNVTFWVMFYLAIHEESVQGLLTRGEDSDAELRLVPKIMEMEQEALSNLNTAIANIQILYMMLLNSVAVNAIAILLKFFKAFQANPRLQLVTKTLSRAATDILHFAVVFLAVFVGFAVTGHILFGGGLIEFSSFTKSVDTSFATLMGEFAWYAEEALNDQSSVNHLILACWFWTFMMFVLLILLNMLLAIILEHYTELCNELKCSSDAPSLVQQTRDYYREKGITKSHIPLHDLECQLEDDDLHLHPETVVNDASLKKAFPTMKDEQVIWLLDWLKIEAKDAKMKCGEDPMTGRLKKIEGFMDNMIEEIRVVKLNTALSASRLGEIVPAPGGPQDIALMAGGAGGTFDGFGNGSSCERSEALSRQLAATTRDLSRITAELSSVTSSKIISDSTPSSQDQLLGRTYIDVKGAWDSNAPEREAWQSKYVDPLRPKETKQMQQIQGCWTKQLVCESVKG